MRKRLVSFCAVLLCGIFSATCLAPVAAAFSNLEQLPIDPWKDLDDVQNRPETLPEVPVQKDEVESVPELKEESPSLKGSAGNRSLNDNDPVRTVTITGYVSVTNGQGGTVVITDKDSPIASLQKKVYEIQYNEEYHLLETADYNGDYGDLGITVGSGTIVDVIAPAYYSSEDYESVKVQGGGTFWLENRLGEPRARANANTAQLLVNGEPYGDIVTMSSGNFTFPSIDLPLSNDVETLGYRFTYTRANTGSATTVDTWTSNFQMFLNDTAVFAVVEVEDEPEYNGLLGTIIGWLQNLWNAITGLGDTIVNGLLDGISGLFVPTEEEITEMKDQYSALLSERLGFIYQGYEWTISSAEEIVDTMESQEEYSFTFPGISIPYQGQTLTIVPEQPVSMENAVMDVLRPVLGTIISLISVAAFAHTAFDMVTALISGVSYFGFLKGKRGGNGE